MATLEGYLLKDGGWRRGWRKRYFKLGKIYFQYFENEGCTSPKGALVRGTIMGVEVVNKTIFQFKVIAKETWMLQAADKTELIQWMETIVPNSAASLRQQPVITRPLPSTSVTAYEPEVEHDYMALPEAMRNPRFSFSEKGSEDDKPSPSQSPQNRRGSTHSVHSNKSRTSNTSDNYLEPNVSPTPPRVAPPPGPTPPPARNSDDELSDEFFCFDDEIKTKPEVDGARATSEVDETRLVPEVDESNEDMSPDPSPLLNRRTIKSKAPNNITYSITGGARYTKDPTGVGTDEEESPPAHRRSIKSAEPGPVLLKVPAKGSSPRLSRSPVDGITTLRVNEWIKHTTSVPKEFDDPDEMDELDKYLVEHSMVLPREDIALLCKIGNGAFGEVWKARATPPVNGQELVAVKTLKEGSSDKNRQDFYGEAALLGQFKHVNVIALHGVVLKEDSPLIVIEFAENGALKSFLKEYGKERHSNQLLGYCRDIACGMKYLSERGYIHRDLAARNVLVSRYECCKIADFGLSRKLGEEDDIYVSRGGMVAIKWTAPEAVLAASYSAQSDVWSAGVTMWEVFSVGANPFSGLANEDAFRNIRRGTRLAKPEKCPVDVYKVLLSCWESNPADRPTFSRLESLLYDPCTDHIEQPIYENNEGLLQYVNVSYENMQDVEQGS